MKRGFAIAILLTLIGCGDSARRPDTGAGAGQPVPPTENCVDLCNRLGSCVVILCDEDTHSMNYDGLGTLLADQCVSTCTDAQVMSGVSSTAWQCIFQSSCRQVFDYDTCHGMGTYHCN
ncbi:MAG TPA: hypothetical protein VKQ32_02145 [Polyangia bacterium]|nr:hypothetical protein [Polyangia bacterium]